MNYLDFTWLPIILEIKYYADLKPNLKLTITFPKLFWLFLPAVESMLNF